MNTKSLVGYFFVSGVCLLLNNVILIMADMIGCTLLISVLLSYSIVVVTGYLLHSLISFRQPFGVAAFGRYALAMAANVPLMFGMILVWRNAVGLPMAFSAPIATGCMFFVNFALCRWAVSAKSPSTTKALRTGRVKFDRELFLPDNPSNNPPCVLASK